MEPGAAVTAGAPSGAARLPLPSSASDVRCSTNSAGTSTTSPRSREPLKTPPLAWKALTGVAPLAAAVLPCPWATRGDARYSLLCCGIPDGEASGVPDAASAPPERVRAIRGGSGMRTRQGVRRSTAQPP
jgi:hypothetical protein